MKINDGPLSQYLIKNLQPLTEADPVLLANYVAALLKNNKPKKELQKLCIEQLYDFLGDGTKSFVTKLFHALEDESVLTSGEDATVEMQNEHVLETAHLDANERKSPPRERNPSAAPRRSGDEVNDESSDDEDDDRNHKHRRRVSRSRSFDRDREDEDGNGRMTYRKHGRLNHCQQPVQESGRHTSEHQRVSSNVEKDGILKYERGLLKGHDFVPHSCLNLEGQRAGGGDGGLRSGSQFSSDVPGTSSRYHVGHIPLRAGLGRGRGPGNGAWFPHEQRVVPLFPDGPDFQTQIIPQGQNNANFFPNRRIFGHVVGPQLPWSGFTHLSAMNNGSVDHPHPLNPGLPSARGPPLHSTVANVMGVRIPRPRCPDFEERGYCLMGDLCPMEHGANRIVVEDVQSLSKYNLPVTLPVRSVPIRAPPVSEPSALSLQMPSMGLAARGSCGSREMALSAGEGMGILNGAMGGTEPDLYDPDQPQFKNEHTNAVPSVKKLPAFEDDRQDWERISSASHEVEDFDFMEFGTSSRGIKPGAGFKVTETLPSVWDRIGPVDHLGSKLTPILSKGPLVKKQMKSNDLEEQMVGRGALQDVRIDGEAEEVEKVGQDALFGHNPGVNIVVTQLESEAQVLRNERKLPSFPRPGGRASGVTGPRAQRTLCVRSIPTASNKKDLLLSHFQKFGMVLDIRTILHSDRAFIQYVRHEDAEKALNSPDAVMGNRFIRLSWAARDSIIDPRELVTSASSEPHSVSFGKNQGVILQDVPALKDAAIHAGTGASELSVKERIPTPTTGNGSAILSLTKKQEELEQMKEEIRKKQEALAKKREDFRERLEKLSNQGTRAPTEVSEGSHAPKRQRLEELTGSGTHADREGSPGAVPSQGVSLLSSTEIEVVPHTPAVSKNCAEENAKVAATVITMTQPAGSVSMTKGIMSPLPRGSLTGSGLSYTPPLAWGPARYKLDNRTTVFRVIPPIPANISDVVTLREHFAKFGQLLSIEFDNKHDGNGKPTENCHVQMTFASRRAAERAFSQARSFQGQMLQFEWVNSTNGNSNSVTGMTLREVDLPKEAAGVSSPNLLMLEVGSGNISEEDALQHPKPCLDQQSTAHNIIHSVSKVTEMSENKGEAF